MRLLLKGARVIDPASGVDGTRDVLIEDGRIAQVDRRHPAQRDGAHARRRAGPVAGGVPRFHRHARAPARAGVRAQGNGGHRRGGGRRRRLHGRGVHAEHEPRERQRQRDALHPEAGGGSRSRARLPHRRGVEGLRRQGTRRDGRHARRRLRGVLRRRTAGGDGAADAPRPRVRRHARPARHRPLRGQDAGRRGRRPRGLPRLAARPARHPVCLRGRDGGARHRAGGHDRRATRTSRT